MLSFGTLASKVFGSSNDRKLKKYAPVVEQINALEPEVAALSDEQLRARTEAFRARVQAGTELDLAPREDRQIANAESAQHLRSEG